jgi:hypothetical protein
LSRSFDALLLDLDGTLLDQNGSIRPRNVSALGELQAAGVRVMITTGRSTVATLRVVGPLELESPMAVFNGAAIYCPRSERLIEERVLSNRALARALEFARGRDLLAVVQQAFDKSSTAPRDPMEDAALRGFTELAVMERDELPTEYVIRVVLFCAETGSAGEFRRAVQEAVDLPTYMTHFPLSALDGHRESKLNVVDIHPPCLGKAEALRYLEETHGILPERVVAVGDAGNDVPMLERAGLGVAMENGAQSALEASDRVIGGYGTDAIASLVDELFLS